MHTQTAPRFQLSALDHIGFQFQSPVLEDELVHLANISSSGVALLKEDVHPPLKPGDTLSGLLFFGATPIPITLYVVHLTGGVIGAAFKQPSTLLQTAIREYFEMEIEGLSCEKVDPKHHKKDPEGEAHWFHGDRCDLFYVTQQDHLIKMRLTFLGLHFEGQNGSPLQIHQVHQDENTSPEFTKEILLKYNAPNDKIEWIQAALKFLRNIPGLPTEHFKELRDYLSPGSIIVQNYR